VLPKLLHPFASPAREDFITVVRGEGALVWDDHGTEYVDALASLWYVNAGHGRREIADAVARQMASLAAFHTFDKFANEPSERLAALVAERAPVDDARVFLVNSGSEAVDTAMKLARLAHVRAGNPQRTLIVSRDRAYHGVNYGGVSAQGLPLNKEGWGALLPEVVQVPADDVEAVATIFATRGDEVAAVLAEPLQGAGGVYPPPEGYLQGLRKLCDQHGAWLIFDEVICGFGRLGTWFGADFYGVRPDLITFAKGVTSGYQPVGGVVVGRTVRQPLEADPSFLLRHGYTYSGHPTACAAGVANLGILEGEDLLSRAVHVGRRLGEGLRSLADDGLVAEVRGEGAVYAVTIPEGRTATGVRDDLLAKGVIARPIVDCLAFCPPLVVTDGQIDRIVDSLADCLK
jgi:adenosylmethionine-8-amino-7-oxononanoate aminotransferase